MSVYDILQVKPDASDDDIKAKYKELARLYHPDKNNNRQNNNTSCERFIKIKHAYDILSNKELKKQYDNQQKYKMKINNGIKIIDGLNIFNLNLKTILLNFIDSTETDKIIKLILKKKENYNDFFDLSNIQNNFNEFIKKLIDIKVVINFDLKDIWECKPKLIKHQRCTKNIFEELIYPIDFKQIYENEGDEIVINNVLYKGDLIVEINVINTTIGDENYYIIDDELYILIDNKRIINNSFYICFLDGNKYKFNITKLKKITKKIGDVYYKKNFGLPKIYLNNITVKNLNFSISIEDIESNIMYSNLFFIIL